MAESDYSPEFVTAASNATITANYWIEIEGVTEKLSKTAVSGLADNVPNLIKSASMSGAGVEVDSPKTPLKSLSVTLVDEDNAVSAIFVEKDLHEKTVKLYYSPDNTLDFSKYGLKAEFRLKELKSDDGNTYILRCIETGELLINPLIIGETILSEDITDIQTANIKVENSDDFTGSSPFEAFIGFEKISFTSVDASGELFGVTRGIDSTDAAEHEAGDGFKIFREVLGVNFIEMILQLMISEGGGGVYDVLDFGLGIREEIIDIAEFEKIRDETAYIVTPTFDIQFKGDEQNFLDFIEDNYLNPSGLRLWYRDNGQISLLIIAEPEPAVPPKIDKTNMIRGLMPKWSASSRRIVNKLIVKVNYNILTDKYERELVFTDTESIAAYGLKRPVTMQTRALQTANGATAFLNTFSNKYFTFYSTPAPELSSTNLMPDKQFFDAGNPLLVSHPDLPNPASTKRGIFENTVQVLGKTFNFGDSITKYKLFYSTLLNFRIGFIAPTGYIASGSHSTTVFDIGTGEGVKFNVGDEVTLWNYNWLSPPVNFSQSTITDITGDQITVSPAFSTTPLENMRLRYADYDQVQESQKLYLFASVSGGGDFGDGEKSYKIST